MSFGRVYYKLNITAASPLAVGSGANADSDKDLIVDSEGVPFIPATSIAGAVRSYLAGKYGIPETNALFGYIADSREANDKQKSGSEEHQAQKSQVRFYDAYYSGKDKYFITNRDCVALEDKVAKPGAKFDFEALETGAKFVSYIELLTTDEKYREMIEDALSAIDSGVIRFGGKTSRGYGRVGLDVSKKGIDSVDDWLKFDMYDEGDWNEGDDFALTESSPFTLKLKLNSLGGLSIREYSTGVGEPDYRTLSLQNDKPDSERTPVIPGTAFAGVIRHRFEELAGSEMTKELFGYVKINDTARAGTEKDKSADGKTASKSKILFSESTLKEGCYKVITRNAIDRFSGATKNGALYTEKAYFGGNTVTEIVFTEKPTEDEVKYLSICLADLHNGFLAIGGLTSIGRGLFCIESINDKECDFSSPKEICALIDECFTGGAVNESGTNDAD